MTAFSVPLPTRLARYTGTARVDWSSATPLWRWRRALTTALGLLWLLDAALQYQPYMFTRAFPTQTIAPTGQGSPGFVHAPVTWAADLLASHLIVYNTLFATIQLAIAVGLFWRATVKLALGASIVWSVLVWWLGEGLGGVLAGPVSPLMGLPGAVILYALIAVLIWPREPGHSESRAASTTLAAASPLRDAGAKLVWLLLWAAFVFEALRPANRTPEALHDLIRGTANGEPHWIAAINTTAASVLAGRGTPASIVLAVLCALIGLCVLIPAATRAGLVLAVLLALTIWVIGEDFGAIATATGTDPNSGIPLALLALCYWPAPAATTRTRPTPPTQTTPRPQASP